MLKYNNFFLLNQFSYYTDQKKEVCKKKKIKKVRAEKLCIGILLFLFS